MKPSSISSKSLSCNLSFQNDVVLIKHSIYTLFITKIFIFVALL